MSLRRVLARTLLLLAIAASGCGVSGRVFLDENRNGRYDAGEPGIPRVPITDGVNFALTDADGRYEIHAQLDPLIQPTKMSIVSVSFPSGYWPTAGWFRQIERVAEHRHVDFPLRRDEQKLPFVFVHATDAHVPRAGREKFIRFRQEMDRWGERFPFCIMTGDNVDLADRQEFRKGQAQYQFLAEQMKDFPLPLFVIPGNHDPAGVNAGKGWDRRHPMYGYGFHWKIVGPLRWSFNYAGIHFVGIDFMYRDGSKWVWGVPDSAVEWLRKDLQRVEPGRRILLFVHFPKAQSKDAFDAVLRTHKVEHIFAGHTHTVETGTYAGVARTFSGALSVIFGKKKDLPGYRFVRVTAKGLSTLYKPTGAEVAVTIDHPRPGGALKPADTIRGKVFDPDGKVKELTVKLDGAAAEVTLRRRPVFGQFTARLAPAAVTAGDHTLEAVASDGRKTWRCRRTCRVP